MDLTALRISEQVVPSNYLKLALEAQRSKETQIKELIEKGKLPTEGWCDELIEQVVKQLSALDSNNFTKNSGMGEREARIACNLVARRHYNFAHGIGRSGDLLEAQPKAVGSTMMSKLTNALLLDLIQTIGIRKCCSCFLLPMATGMALTLCFLSLRRQRPKAKYILWSRIDQKSCFKSMTTAGFIPIIIQPQRNDDNSALNTNLREFKARLDAIPNEDILCIMSTTSCFAPRNCDDIIRLAEMAKAYDVPHVVNNAYGLQSTFFSHQIQQGQRLGRIDLFIQSTDKNLMVPVGGAIVAGFNEATVKNVAKTYAGRASSSQSLDVFMTLLSLGKYGYAKLCDERKNHFKILRARLQLFSEKFHCKLIECKANPISLALCMDGLEIKAPTKLGAMLFTRGISGARVVIAGSTATIDNFEFLNWGTHANNSGPPYLTVAAALGITQNDIDVFMKKLEACWKGEREIKSHLPIQQNDKM